MPCGPPRQLPDLPQDGYHVTIIARAHSKSTCRENTMIPDDRNYTNYHLWIKLDGEPVQIGVTQPLLESIRPLLALDLPDPDDDLTEPVPFGEVEGQGAIHQLYTPVDALVLEVNEKLIWDPDLLLADPYYEGWLLKISIEQPDRLRNLMTAEAYARYCRGVFGEKE